ncbi:uncharacterized protein BJ171DRAFT_235319 [Polychytrium aggregatum]|uniref:uncharacterized protein n=1 Tax=Polychytrium aggregatum TaxID=110093 RepID=UPI0022FF416B|nr:uncharacterized protein BJ171DRAFT_235319 [Polychytrium aggregatum]KAI9208145.1 hypothetical protein BJ171DRAFT_235319 [Polychytrium aggregatum]
MPCPETIIFCLDTSAEVQTGHFNQMTYWEAIREDLMMFVHQKHSFSPNHQFGILNLALEVFWELHPTTDIEKFNQAMQLLRPFPERIAHCDLSSCITSVKDHIPKTSQEGILRIIVVYARSKAPTLESLEQSPAIQKYDNVFVDYLILCSDINDPEVTSIDLALNSLHNHWSSRTGEGYCFTASKRTQAQWRVISLLAHPDQRPKDQLSD